MSRDPQTPPGGSRQSEPPRNETWTITVNRFGNIIDDLVYGSAQSDEGKARGFQDVEVVRLDALQAEREKRERAERERDEAREQRDIAAQAVPAGDGESDGLFATLARLRGEPPASGDGEPCVYCGNPTNLNKTAVFGVAGGGVAHVFCDRIRQKDRAEQAERRLDEAVKALRLYAAGVSCDPPHPATAAHGYHDGGYVARRTLASIEAQSERSRLPKEETMTTARKTILSAEFADKCRANGLSDNQIQRFLEVLSSDPQFQAMVAMYQMTLRAMPSGAEGEAPSTERS